MKAAALTLLALAALVTAGCTSSPVGDVDAHNAYVDKLNAVLDKDKATADDFLAILSDHENETLSNMEAATRLRALVPKMNDTAKEAAALTAPASAAEVQRALVNATSLRGPSTLALAACLESVEDPNATAEACDESIALSEKLGEAEDKLDAMIATLNRKVDEHNSEHA